MGCLNPSKLLEATAEVKKQWKESKSIERFGFTEDTGVFKRLFEAATGKELLAGSYITPKDMNKMKVAIKDLDTRLKKPGLISNKFLKSFYIGAAKAWRNPVTEQFYQTLINANEFRNRNTVEMMANYKDVISSLKLAMIEAEGVAVDKMQSGSYDLKDVIHPGNIKGKHIANDKFKKLNELESAVVKKLKNGEQVDTSVEMAALLKFVENEGAAFQDFMDVALANGDLTAIKHKYRGKPTANRYIRQISNSVSAWQKIESSSKKHLMSSIDNVIETVKMKYGATDPSSKRLVKEYQEVYNKLENFKEGYVPHFVLDLFADSIAFGERMTKAVGEKERNDVMSEYTKKIADINTNLIARLKPKGKEFSEPYSRNPMLYIRKYVEQVASFNHRSFVDRAYVDGLQKLTTAITSNPNTKEAKTAEVYQKILTDFHADATGINRIEKSPTGANITRLITSLQFVSKLGFSTRGALRNSTQRLLNYQWFGALQQADTIRAFRANKEYSDAANHELHRHGLEFVDIGMVTEGAVTAADMVAQGINIESGMLTYSQKKNILHKMTSGGQKLAEASSVLTKWAENSNRRSTFRVAFHERVKQLKLTDEYSAWGSSKETETKMYKKAGNYASRMVSLLHFEYSPFGKANVMKSGVGQVMGQFQHYAFSFAQLQMKMVRDYNRARKGGDYFGPEAGRIFRMFMLHGLTALASGIFNVDFGNYIQHDTFQRATELGKLIQGDEDAFYGIGLVGATGMVPLSDAVEIINLGAAAGYWNLLADPESTQGFLMGMRKYKSIDDAEFGKELAGMFSIQGERILRRTIPAFWSESPLTSVIRAELGLYPGKTQFGVKTRDIHQKIFQKKKKRKISKSGSSPYNVPNIYNRPSIYQGSPYGSSPYSQKSSLSNSEKDQAIDTLNKFDILS